MGNGSRSPRERHRRTEQEQFSPEQLRALFHRKALAGERHRAAVARMLGMDATEAAALAHLAQHGQLTPGELAGLVGLTSGGTTALIHRLVESGHIARHPHPRDRRSSILMASPEVLDRAEQLFRPLVQEMDVLAVRLSDAQRTVIGRYLTEVAEVTEDHAGRLHAIAREEQRETVAPPAPGMWA
jgi:DNA-binding MarR family transcriptional regulator